MTSKIEIELNSDRELVRNAQLGCTESMAILVRRYQMDVRNFLARRTGSLEMADDLTQDAFVAAIGQLDRLKEHESFKSWLLSIARNKSVDHLRNLSRDRRTLQQAIEFLITRQCTSRLHRTTIWQSDELLQALNDCIAKLGTQGRTLVQKFYFDNESAESIAECLGQRGNTVRMALLRIRKTLARCIRKNTESEL